VPSVSFYGLQLGKAAQQLDGFRDRIHDLAPQLTDWTATAGALQELDLLISIDSAVANLAGALGRPVWVCLPPAPDWRWLLDRPDTPWYGERSAVPPAQGRQLGERLC
jgi:ADP-heptose:LPS heptosyltransferase